MLGFRVCLQTRTKARPVLHKLVHKLASVHKATVLPPKQLQSLLNPFTALEDYLHRSVDTSSFHLFQPRLEDVAEAEKLFISSSTHRIDYYTSAERMEHAPRLQQPEVCFIGRSNVGKSSLIKALFSLSPEVEVRVSKTPGHTKKMNFFKVGGAFTLVDMPGYGYRAPKDFVDIVESYLYTRTNLVRTFLLMDASVGLQQADMVALEMCEEIRSPYVIVATKVDKCGSGELLKNLIRLRDLIQSQTSCCFPQPFLISSLRFQGIYHLRCFICHITGAITLQDTSAQE
ncbi:GTP-binding protein 8 [Gouania willdenowi]|uniref:GTP-binding protein 8 n=1 Tax=Gouania willdenowi TaxID=441366 RepID=A0A8C5DDW3_GOUWI|nr:GTP-binding protein 8 [Gouania willdenowi]